MPNPSFTCNDRTYAPPAAPIAVICIDGCADEYLSTSLARGRMPRLAEILETGHRSMVRAALPTFTNVNNSAILTGQPPAVTGIAGNFFLNPDTSEEVMMNAAEFLRCDTILNAAAADRRVAMVTAKQKLLTLLAHELDGIAFSIERVAESAESDDVVKSVYDALGRQAKIYSGDASVDVLRAGVHLIRSGQADFCYLTLTDYMQHKYGPADEPSLAFHAELDREIGELHDLGVVIGITADHGMNGKAHADGTPKVCYLESRLVEKFGEGPKVICPITDPYVKHHGALGAAVTVYLPDSLDSALVANWITNLDGIAEVHSRSQAVCKLELPEDRIGDLYVLATRDYVIGKTPADHDLAQLDRKLRSHGGRYEEMVPLIISQPLSAEYLAAADGDPRNFDVFDFVCNGLAVSQ